MLAEIGHFSIILAFCVSIFVVGVAFLRFGSKSASASPGSSHESTQISTLNIAASRHTEQVMHQSAYLVFGLITGAFLILLIAFYTSDFSVAIVAENSHSAKPLLFKATATWGNHEGSMLLWVLVLATATAALAEMGRRKELKQASASGGKELVSYAVAVQFVIIAAFLAFILFTSNPFARLIPTPEDGSGLNPLLQDIGLAIHPPFLYLGYVGLSVPFSLAVAGLLTGKVDREWAALIRPFVLVAWAMLTVGILLGSWWAYYELGWGGWWAWDPVENASFMPWLAATALLHSVRIVELRGNFKTWTVLLAISAFSLSLVGTFLVRSGILTSVHAFATDPARGVFVLIILAGLTGAALLVFAQRAFLLVPESRTETLSRENVLLTNNIFLITACATVFLGTFYPLFLDVLNGAKISVGAPYFNIVFLPLACAMVFLAAFGGIIPWRGTHLKTLRRKLIVMGGCAAFVAMVCFVVIERKFAVGFLAIFLSVWLMAGSVQSLRTFKGAGKNWWRASKPIWGMTLAHVGLAVFVLGVAGISLWQSKQVRFMSEGDSIQIAGIEVSLTEVLESNGPNFVAERARFTAQKNTAALDWVPSKPSVIDLIAERRYYPVRRIQTTEAAIQRYGLSDLYITLGERVANEGWPVTLYYNPFVILLWVGGGFTALGGLVSLLVTNLRVRRIRIPAVNPKVRRVEGAQ